MMLGTTNIKLYHVVFIESATGAVHRIFHILGHSIVGQSRSMGMLGVFGSVFIRMTIVSYICGVCMFAHFQFCPAVLCRRSSSPVSAGNPGSQVFFPCWEDSCSVAESSISLTTGLLLSLHSDLVFAGVTGVGRGILPLRVLGRASVIFWSVEGREWDPKGVVLPQVPRHGRI